MFLFGAISPQQKQLPEQLTEELTVFKALSLKVKRHHQRWSVRWIEQLIQNRGNTIQVEQFIKDWKSERTRCVPLIFRTRRFAKTLKSGRSLMHERSRGISGLVLSDLRFSLTISWWCSVCYFSIKILINISSSWNNETNFLTQKKSKWQGRIIIYE